MKTSPSSELDAIDRRISRLSRQIGGLRGEVLRSTAPDEYSRLKQALDEATRDYFLKLFDENTASMP